MIYDEHRFIPVGTGNICLAEQRSSIDEVFVRVERLKKPTRVLLADGR
jgi:hypothetical protein